MSLIATAKARSCSRRRSHLLEADGNTGAMLPESWESLKQNMVCDLHHGKGLPNSRFIGWSMSWIFFVGIEVVDERLQSCKAVLAALLPEGDARHILLLLTSLTWRCHWSRRTGIEHGRLANIDDLCDFSALRIIEDALLQDHKVVVKPRNHHRWTIALPSPREKGNFIIKL